MAARPSNVMLGPFLAWASRLRFPMLFAGTAVLFILDVLIPDMIPFVDEVLLGLLTILLASIRRKTRVGSSAGPQNA